MPGDLERLRTALASHCAVEAALGAGRRTSGHKRQVAIKVLHADIAAALGTERFLREIEIVAGLHHPHILPLYDSGRPHGGFQPFLLLVI